MRTASRRHSRARAELLDTYEAERRPIAERAQKIRDSEFLDAVVGRCSGISYTYRDYVPKVPGLAETAGPAIGDRAPDLDFDEEPHAARRGRYGRDVEGHTLRPTTALARLEDHLDGFLIKDAEEVAL